MGRAKWRRSHDPDMAESKLDSMHVGFEKEIEASSRLRVVCSARRALRWLSYLSLTLNSTLGKVGSNTSVLYVRLGAHRDVAIVRLPRERYGSFSSPNSSSFVSVRLAFAITTLGCDTRQCPNPATWCGPHCHRRVREPL